MADLKTKYMSLDLANPVVVGACSLSKTINQIKEIEEAGAGALVIKSLFEEQIQAERAEMDDKLTQYDDLHPEALSLFPSFEHGPQQHLFWVRKAREAVSLPLIASLNAVTDEVWVDYARQLAETGVDGLELNFYSPALDPRMTARDMERRELDVFARVREAVKIPLSVKLHPFYTNVFNHATQLDQLGADAVVLFNRLLQPDIDVDKLSEKAPMVLSTSGDSLIALRWIALLRGHLEADLVANTGILTGQDAVKMILAGAGAVQVVSALYQNAISHIGQMNKDIARWMDQKGYATLEDFRGKVSKQQLNDPWAFERSQYIKALLGYD